MKLNPPPFTFVSLNPGCDHHTLVIKTGGHLKVSSNVYVNSCSDDDGFDLFGDGGTFEVYCFPTAPTARGP